MRDPALHITKSDFITVLKKVGVATPDKVADAIYEAAVPYHIKNRYIIQGDVKTIQKVTRVIDNRNIAKFSVEKFNGLLCNLRQMRGARFIQKINKGSNDWLMLGEILTLADSFVDTFKFQNPEEGYKTFLSIGLDLMGRKYGLSKYKYWASKIHEQYECVKVLEEDYYPEGTIKFWEAWKVAMQENAGSVMDILVPELMINMIYGRQEADECKANYADWIEAQFDQLSFLESIPELSQFFGKNAKLRYEKHMLKKSRNKKEGTKVTKAEEDTYNLPGNMSEDQREYFAALRAKRAGD